MRLLINERRQGQKNHILREAAKMGYAIVTIGSNHSTMRSICKSIGIECPQLITYDQFIKKDYDWAKGIIIHEFDELLRKMSNSQIIALTMVKSIEL